MNKLAKLKYVGYSTLALALMATAAMAQAGGAAAAAADAYFHAADLQYRGHQQHDQAVYAGRPAFCEYVCG